MADWKLLGMAALVPLAVLTQGAVKPAPKGPVVVYSEMHDHVAAKAQVLWDITNAKLDDEGNPSAKKMEPADWIKLRAALTDLSASLNRLGGAKSFVVRKADQQILDEQTPGGAKPADIQRHIDANPAGFRQYAIALARQIDGIGKAADRRDLKTVYEAAGELDGQCETCHQTFWFPKDAQ